MTLRERIKYKLLDMAHDDGRGPWHKHHDLLERIAYGRWLQRKMPRF